jgi:anaerobic C4-dicarboxylate transporter DcuA
MLLIEVLVMAILIVFGLRKANAMGVGAMSVVGVIIMVFAFRLPPGQIPMVPVMIILAIGIAGGFLEASGGIDVLVHWATKAIERFPGAITFVAPLVIFLFVFGIGTANIALSLEPVISRTALKAKVRPERPLIAAVTTANLALVTSPAASSAITAVGFLSGYNFSMGKYMLITVPSALVASIGLSIFLCFWGKPLSKDKEYQRRVEEGVITDADTEEAKGKSFTGKQYACVAAFLFAVAAILCLGLIEPAIPFLTTPAMGPDGTPIYLSSTSVVQMFMYLAAVIIMVITGLQPKALYTTQIMPSAINAAVAVLGPGWLGATVFQAPANAEVLSNTLGPLFKSMPWIVVLLSTVVAIFVMSQTAIISIIYPLALGLGVPAGFMAAIIQTVNVNYFIPAQPTLLFAEEIDKTGTTTKWRFWPGGVVATVISILFGLLMWKVFL